MAQVKFAQNYDHVWPTRAMTAYKAGWSGTVKREVAERARAAGALDDTMPSTRAELETLAADEGVDLATVTGTGRNGQVLNADISAAILAKRAGTVGAIHHDESKPGAVIGSGGPSGNEAPTE